MSLADVLARIEKRLEATGLKASKASTLAGLGEDAIRNMQRAVKTGQTNRGASTNTLTRLAPVLETTVAWLLEGAGPEEAPVDIPILGFVGANPDGEVIFSTGQGTGDTAPRRTSPTENVLEVRGHSMPFFAEDGSLIYFDDQRSEPSPEMLGHVVVVELATGEVLVKRLLRGSRKGRFDLESIAGPRRENEKLNWVARITAVIPPLEARRIIKRGGMATEQSRFYNRSQIE